MIEKALATAILALVLLLAGSLYSYQRTTLDPPPGVAAADWLPLTDNAGVLVIRNRKFLGNPNSTDLRGILYVKVRNVWHRLYFDQAPLSIIPAR